MRQFPPHIMEDVPPVGPFSGGRGVTSNGPGPPPKVGKLSVVRFENLDVFSRVIFYILPW